MTVGKSQPGESNPSSKLTADDVRQIRQRHADGVSLRELADDHDVTGAAVWLAVHHKTWAHVE